MIYANFEIFQKKSKNLYAILVGAISKIIEMSSIIKLRNTIMEILAKLRSVKIRLTTVLYILVPTVLVIVGLAVLSGTFIANRKMEASTRRYETEIANRDKTNKEFRDSLKDVIALKDRYRTAIKDMVETLYDRDSYLAVGGTAPGIIEDTDEAVLLQIRNTVATMEDDQRLLQEVKNYLVARKEFADSFPFIWPTIRTGVPKITSGFGFREDLDGKKELHYHTGIDIGGERGDQVIATAEGKVVAVYADHELYGKLIIIQHKYDFVTYYAHLDKIKVQLGQIVKRGDKIGEMGNSGDSKGYHLHYEIRRDSAAIDPMTFLNLNY